MIVRRFLLWARAAQPGDRAEAVAALARAYLYSDLSPEDRWEAETALTAMLDDGSVLVRRAMAEALASSPAAPRHVILALAADGADVSTIVLRRSPVLADCDLVDCAALGDDRVQVAIASRPWLSRSASAALAEIGAPAALVALASNWDAEIADFSLARMIARHGGNAELREALLARPDLPVEIAQAIAAALAEALGAFVQRCGWLSGERSGRVMQEARERTTVALSSAVGPADVDRLVDHLRRSGQLTPALILRAILSGSSAFAEAAFAALSGFPRRRVLGILRDGRGPAFAALYARTGLPPTLRRAFEAALDALRTGVPAGSNVVGLSRPLVGRALASCEALLSGEDEAGRLVALLRRFDMEAAREEARRVAGDLADSAALAIVLAHDPESLDVPPPAERAA